MKPVLQIFPVFTVEGQDITVVSSFVCNMVSLNDTSARRSIFRIVDNMRDMVPDAQDQSFVALRALLLEQLVDLSIDLTVEKGVACSLLHEQSGTTELVSGSSKGLCTIPTMLALEEAGVYGKLRVSMTDEKDELITVDVPITYGNSLKLRKQKYIVNMMTNIIDTAKNGLPAPVAKFRTTENVLDYIDSLDRELQDPLKEQFTRVFWDAGDIRQEQPQKDSKEAAELVNSLLTITSRIKVNETN